MIAYNEEMVVTLENELGEKKNIEKNWKKGKKTYTKPTFKFNFILLDD